MTLLKIQSAEINDGDNDGQKDLHFKYKQHVFNLETQGHSVELKSKKTFNRAS